METSRYHSPATIVASLQNHGRVVVQTPDGELHDIRADLHPNAARCVALDDLSLLLDAAIGWAARTGITAEDAHGVKSSGYWAAMQQIADILPDGWERWLADTAFDGKPSLPDQILAVVRVLVDNVETGVKANPDDDHAALYDPDSDEHVTINTRIPGVLLIHGDGTATLVTDDTATVAVEDLTDTQYAILQARLQGAARVVDRSRVRRVEITAPYGGLTGGPR